MTQLLLTNKSVTNIYIYIYQVSYEKKVIFYVIKHFINTAVNPNRSDGVEMTEILNVE